MSELHAIRRARQRVKLEITRDTLAIWVEMILDGRAKFLRRTSPRSMVWQVKYGGAIFDVAYDEPRKMIVTVLDPRGKRPPKASVPTKAERRRTSILRAKGLI